MPTTDTRPNALDALSDIAFTINSIQEPKALLAKVLEIAMDALDAERGFVLLSDEEAADGFTVRAQRNFTDEQLDNLVQLSTSVVYEVLREGEPVLIYEALEDDRFGGSESIVLQQIQSIACVPLRLKDRQIGAIYLDSLTKRGRFTRDHLPFIDAVANQAAIALENAQLYQSLREENRQLRTEMQRLHGFDEIIGDSAAMQEVFDIMSRVLDSDVTVLIEGESGTGKELVARAIHYNGHRKDDPFVAIFCGSLSDELLESELFGHKKGAFTGATADKKGLFETADGGTVFLDEVGDLSSRLQTSLLRVLQEGEIKRVGETQVRRVDVRILSATNTPLQELVEEGSFREDLYYRLNTISVTMPPLRHRRSDIPMLANHFLDKYATGRRSHIRGFEPDAIKALKRHRWPGNVRELENTIERAAIMAGGDLIAAEDLRLPDQSSLDPFEPGITLKEAERRIVLRTLDDCDDNISETARVLDVSRRWLHYRLKEWEGTDA
ncbi:MAG: GAF domain-containing protein [Bacteroidetes bacterium]|jgi:Nif-specific regulatory protein|nr:GAF domain-containing protein [Bacteroidota bacterium]